MRVWAGPGVVAASVVLAACGHEVVDASPEVRSGAPAPRPAPTQLSCPSNEMVSTAGGYLKKMPDGFDTREEAVESWLATTRNLDGEDWSDADYVIAEGGHEAWVLRDNGSAQARVDFLFSSGFTVQGYDACA